MRQPPSLQKGDQIHIISTARKISKDELQAAVELLKTWKLKVIFGKHLFSEDNQFAGTKEERISDIQAAMDDPECKAILCARGGYGTVQLIDHIDFKKFTSNPKWIVGYSDVTVLHTHINQNFGIETLHAIMPINFPKTGENQATKSLKAALFGENCDLAFSPKSGSILPKEKIEAPIVGGNLSILYSLSGSISQLDTKGKILFIEDLDEYLYHIDRMMMNLKRSGLFTECKAILVGGMSDMNDNAVPYGKTAEEIILANTADLNIPVIFGVPAGHIEENRTLIFNRSYQLSIEGDLVNLKANGRA